MNEERDQVPPCICPPESGINVFARPVSLLNKTESRLVGEYLPHLLLLYRVFLRILLNNIFEPDQACDPHGVVPTKLADLLIRKRIGGMPQGHGVTVFIQSF